MMPYYTPIEVANILARHVPRGISSVLDPSVGAGILLEPIVVRLHATLRNVTCIDIDADVLRDVKHRFAPLLRNALDTLRADFLEWSSNNNRKELKRFDCIVVNPPFSGHPRDWVNIRLGKEYVSNGSEYCTIPIEAAFVVRSLSLLRPGGKLLAIVPATLISSIRMKWLRQDMMNMGAFEYVHELPRFTFKGVESRVYLIIYRKSAKQRDLIVCNHDLIKSVRLSIKREDLRKEARFDYSFFYALKWYKQIIMSSCQLGWTKLEKIVTIYRGTVKSPLNGTNALHTCNYKDGFWHYANDSKYLLMKRSDRLIRVGDILVKRVGRDCAKSFGIVIGRVKCPCSDCILIIRPKQMASSIKMLFAIRVLLSLDVGANLIERGTGAAYLTKEDLGNLYVPVGLADKHPKLFLKYQEAVSTHHIDVMEEIECHIRQRYFLVDSIRNVD